MDNKRAQEEIVGFALIVIVVAVILLILLGFYLATDKKETVESYEVDGFIQAFLQHTTDCEDNFEKLSLQKVIFDCIVNGECEDGTASCEVLEEELRGIIEASWKVGENSPYKAYELKILYNEEELLILSEGNKTRNSKGGTQDLRKSGVEIDIFLNVYS